MDVSRLAKKSDLDSNIYMPVISRIINGYTSLSKRQKTLSKNSASTMLLFFSLPKTRMDIKSRWSCIFYVMSNTISININLVKY